MHLQFWRRPIQLSQETLYSIPTCPLAAHALQKMIETVEHFHISTLNNVNDTKKAQKLQNHRHKLEE